MGHPRGRSRAVCPKPGGARRRRPVAGRPGRRRAGPARPNRWPRPRCRSPLRAMTATDIIDGAWGVIKARPKTVFAITAMIILPIEILAAFLAQGSVAVRRPRRVVVRLRPVDARAAALGGAGSDARRSSSRTSAPFFLGARHRPAGVVLVRRRRHDRPAGRRRPRSARRRRCSARSPSWCRSSSLGWATCGLGPALPDPADDGHRAGDRDRGPRTARRTASGPSTSPGAATGRASACGRWRFLVEIIVNFALSIVPTLISAIIARRRSRRSSPAAGTGLRRLRHQARSWSRVAVLLYLDLRVRTEGLDLELEATAAFARAA